MKLWTKRVDLYSNFQCKENVCFVQSVSTVAHPKPSTSERETTHKVAKKAGQEAVDQYVILHVSALLRQTQPEQAVEVTHLAGAERLCFGSRV